MLDSFGWLATAVSISSYFCRDSVKLRCLQAFASVVWIIYGLLIHAVPLIAANVLVGSAAGWSAYTSARRVRPDALAIQTVRK